MYKVFFFFSILTLVSCKTTIEKPIQLAQATVINRTTFLKLVNTPASSIEVINFWATWCVPCIEELPAFQKASNYYGDDAQFTYISLDDADKLKTKVQPFIEKNELTGAVLILDDPYAAEWIPLVDKHWDGAIPATLIKTPKGAKFYAQSFTYAQLKEAINDLL